MAASGVLYVVATPIGNLGDISRRAVEILGSVDLVAAEDTRVTGRLLAYIGVKTRMVSYRDENERRLSPRLVRSLQAGQSIALVSDAGTPCISDPGYRLVRAAAEAGIEVVTLPGPSAAIALLAVAGLPTDRFAFEGFLPPAGGARRKLLESMRSSGRTTVVYESPRRIVRLLEELADVLDDPPVAVGRELTKLHEEVLRGKASEIAGVLADRGPRGEFVVAVYAAGAPAVLDGEALRAEVERLLAQGSSVRDAAERLKERGVSRRAVYEAARSVKLEDENV